MTNIARMPPNASAWPASPATRPISALGWIWLNIGVASSAFRPEGASGRGIEGRQTLERHPQAVTTLAPLKSLGREQPRPLYSDQRRITPFASTMLLSQATYHAVRC